MNFNELYNRAKESGKPLIIDALHINSRQGRCQDLELEPAAAGWRTIDAIAGWDC